MKYRLTCFILLMTVVAFAQETPAKIPHKLLSEISVEEIDSILNEVNDTYKYRELNLFIDGICEKLNGTILIAKDDSTIIRKTVGTIRLYENKKGYEEWTNTELRNAKKRAINKLQDNTFYELASLSKQFTAAAILKLVDDKKLKLTDTLRKFYPELPYQNITIHQMLAHTSGLPEYFEFPFEYFDTTVLLTNQMLVEVLAEQQPEMQFAPGKKFEYTNTNYALLAAIIEKVTGKKFEEYVRRNIFLPAGMTKTFFVTQLDQRKYLSIAIGHLRTKEELKQFFMNGTLGDKGVYSTPEELMKWKKAFFDDKIIISEELLEKAISKENYIKGRGVAKELYGYGFRLEDNPPFGKLIYHGGLWRGFQNVMVYQPEDNVFIIFLSNFRNSAHLGQSDEILHILEGA